jgi:hypothetical protein
MWQFKALRRQDRARGNHPITDKNQQAIIQRYIKDPLLLESRKSEARVYWLVASLDPFMALLYP